MPPRQENLFPEDAFQRSEAPSRWSGLPLRVRLGAYAAIPTLVASAVLGPNVCDEVDAFMHSDDYYSAEWMNVETYVPGAYSDIIAKSVQEDNVESTALVNGEDTVRINIFQEGAVSDDSVLITPFTSMRGTPYGVISAITYGNPNFRLDGTTGGILPVPEADAAEISDTLGIKSYGEHDFEQQALIWCRFINNKAAALWSLNAVGGTYKGATEPRQEQELWMSDTMNSYVKSIGLKNGDQPLTTEEATQIAGVIYSIAAGYDQQNNETFQAFMKLPESGPNFDNSMSVLVDLAVRESVDGLIFPEAIQDDIDEARKTYEEQQPDNQAQEDK